MRIEILYYDFYDDTMSWFYFSITRWFAIYFYTDFRPADRHYENAIAISICGRTWIKLF